MLKHIQVSYGLLSLLLKLEEADTCKTYSSGDSPKKLIVLSVVALATDTLVCFIALTVQLVHKKGNKEIARVCDCS